jgi:predicted amidophosphoribosyltransferase
LDIKANFKIVNKVKYSRQQSKLSKYERENNLKNSFKISKNYINQIKGKTIIIVDDVIST